MSDISAKGAADSPSAWGSAPGLRARPKEPALKARFNSQNRFHPHRQVKRAFSACYHGNLKFWGDAPGWYDTAPLALYTSRARKSVPLSPQ
jgi:hypothetical protein